jgi:hypothetical protein
MADFALAPLSADDRAPPRKADRRPNDACDAPAAPSGTARCAHYAKRPLSTVASWAFVTILVALLFAGWLTRGEEYVVPDSGAGYWLGVAGATLMLLLLLYPLRKRVRVGRFMGSVVFWFRLHMVLGVVGPALILFHANFSFGSLNSNVAMVAMLVVATSGFVGRYLYRKIHLGLYGRKAVVQEVLADAEALEHSLGDELPGCDQIVAQMHAFATRAAQMPSGVLTAAWTLPALGLRARFMRRRLRREAYSLVKAEGRRRGWSRRLRAQHHAAIADLVTLHLAAVRKAAAFELYDRLFGLWHVLHLPLFIILLIAATIHVFAAHFY